MLSAFCLLLALYALFIFTVCPFHHLWHKKIFFSLYQKKKNNWEGAHFEVIG